MPTATNDVIFAFIGSPMGLLACWLVALNLATFVMFGVDKWKSTHQTKRRIPERNLLLSAALGGSIGAFLGMRVWHHKTLHKVFSVGIPLIFLIQVALAGGLYLYWNFMR
ncbi:MAG: DUF1294 domain-containing protein [Oscillibacter sp.]